MTYWEERASHIREEALRLAETAGERLSKEYAKAANATLKEYADLVRPWRNKDGSYDVAGIRFACKQDPNFRLKYQRFSSNLDAYLNKIAKDEQTIISKTLMGIYRTTDLQLFNKTWNLLNEKAVEMAILTPWTSDGINFSSRIWKNTEQLKAEMKDIMLDSVLKGQNPRKTARKLVERYGVGASQAERLVRTETMAIYNQAAFEGYKDLGIEQYEILGSPDDHMCEPSGTRHYMYEFDEGHTAPPFHPNCKCCIIPVVD